MPQHCYQEQFSVWPSFNYRVTELQGLEGTSFGGRKAWGLKEKQQTSRQVALWQQKGKKHTQIWSRPYGLVPIPQPLPVISCHGTDWQLGIWRSSHMEKGIYIYILFNMWNNHFFLNLSLVLKGIICPADNHSCLSTTEQADPACKPSLQWLSASLLWWSQIRRKKTAAANYSSSNSN